MKLILSVFLTVAGILAIISINQDFYRLYAEVDRLRTENVMLRTNLYDKYNKYQQLYQECMYN